MTPYSPDDRELENTVGATAGEDDYVRTPSTDMADTLRSGNVLEVSANADAMPDTPPDSQDADGGASYGYSFTPTASAADQGDTTEGGDDETEAIRADIEQTRTELTVTIDAIQEKLNPQNLVDQAKDTVREA